MQLKQPEMLELYEAVIKPFGHPDPLGFVTRAFMTSGGDPDFVGDDGDQGFMPVSYADAYRMTGAAEVYSVQANIVATMTMDRMYFEQYGSVSDMIVAFHFGEQQLTSGEYTKQQKEFIAEVNKRRQEVYEFIYPPFATVNDVVDALNIVLSQTDVSKDRLEIYKKLLEG